MPIDWKKINPAHTPGIPDYFDESLMDNFADLWQDTPNYRIRTSKDFFPLFIDKEMAFEPGTNIEYNNTGFVVLGLIIEAIEQIIKIVLWHI